jgi:dUTP pyrophosphatase
MRLKIHLVDNSLPVPQYQTSGSVAFDLYSREDIVVKPKEIKIAPANVIVEVPEGFMLMIAPRSSLPVKKGLALANSVGILDQDYRGPDDEIKLELYNFTDKEVEIKRGERLAQAILVKIEQAELEEIKENNNESRGGIGSTGGY